MYPEIGIFSAKARLSELLRSVREEGCSYTITVRGECVADLVPCQSARRGNAQAAIEALLAIERVRGVGDEELKSLIEEGRA
jgi:prevent-host-death family protein